MASFPRVSFLLLFGLFIFSNVANADNESGESSCKGDGATDKGCPLEGNTDFYGGGVRMGICKSIALDPTTAYMWLSFPQRSRLPMVDVLAGKQLPRRRNHWQSRDELDFSSCAVRNRVHLFYTGEPYPCGGRVGHPSALRGLSIQHHESLGVSDK